MSSHHHHHKSKAGKIFLYVLCTILLIAVSSYLIVRLGRKFSWFGLDIEALYQEMNDGKINRDSILTFKIESNNCTLLGKYAGPDYRLIESVGAGESCQKYTYKMGEDPNEFTDQLIRDDIMYDNMRQ